MPSRRLRSADQAQDTPPRAVSRNPGQTGAGGRTRPTSQAQARTPRRDTPPTSKFSEPTRPLAPATSSTSWRKCRNPVLAEERARKRAALLEATEAALAPIAAAVLTGRLTDPAKIGVRVGKVLGTYKMAKHFVLHIGPGPLTYTRDQAAIAAQAAIDGIYLLRTSIATDQLDTPAVVSTDKALARVERDFRSLKTIDIQLRPIHHHTQPRVRAHVFLCPLAAYLLWHLRQALAPLTYTDQHPPERTNPVAPATGSTSAQRKARTHLDADGQPLHSFQGLLDHLGSLTRNELRFPQLPDAPVIEQLTVPTPVQRRAFELLDAPIPPHLK